MPRVFRDGNATVMLDERYLPLVITQWRGAATLPLVEQYFDGYAPLVRSVATQGGRLVSVSDVLDAERPDAMTRKEISKRVDAIESECPGVMLYPSYLALDSALLRGTITAINWISRSALDVVALPTLLSALEHGLARIEEEELETPAGFVPGRYRLPAA